VHSPLRSDRASCIKHRFRLRQSQRYALRNRHNAMARVRVRRRCWKHLSVVTFAPRVKARVVKAWNQTARARAIINDVWRHKTALRWQSLATRWSASDSPSFRRGATPCGRPGAIEVHQVPGKVTPNAGHSKAQTPRREPLLARVSEFSWAARW